MQEIDIRIKERRQEIDRFLLARNFIETNQSKFSALPTATVFLSGDGTLFIDFNSLSHAEVMSVVMAFSGKWSREPVEERINYTLNLGDLSIRCWKGEPPPNCRVVYEEIHEPEHVVPARTRRVPKIMCRPVEHALPEQSPEPAELMALGAV